MDSIKHKTLKSGLPKTEDTKNSTQDEPQSLIDVLQQRAKTHPNKTVFTFLHDGKDNATSITFSELDRKVRSIAASLQKDNLKGERALIIIPPGLDFIYAFLACSYAGLIAVPSYPPGLTRASARSIRMIAKDSSAKALLSTSKWLAENKFDEILSDSGISSENYYAIEETEVSDSFWSKESINKETISFLQYTSGTTGDPKGVMVSHGNLLANLETIRTGLGYQENDTGVFWLPPYHDMGLIGTILTAIYSNFHCVLMAPATFIRSPLKWLQSVTKYKATAIGGPNFGYEMCVNAASKSKKADLGLDLSTLKVAFNGAEMVRVNSINNFTQVFEKYGFNKNAIMPCYGLAETTLLCTTRSRMEGMYYQSFDIDKIDQEKVIDISRKNKSESGNRERQIVSCGKSVGTIEYKVVNTQSLAECDDYNIGEVWIAGPSVATGYWNRQELSDQIFKANIKGEKQNYLRTGDRGFTKEGELYIVGRMKDLIIVRGRNYGAEDIEQSVRETDESIKAHRCIAATWESGDSEELIVSIEFDKKNKSAPKSTGEVDKIESFCKKIRLNVLEDHGVEIDTIIIQKNGHTPITTSGKLRRSLCVAGYKNGTDELFYVKEFSQPKLIQNNSTVGEESMDLQQNQTSERRSELTYDELLPQFKSFAEDILRQSVSVKDKFSTLGLCSIKTTELVVAMSDIVGWDLPLEIIEPQSCLHQIALNLSCDGQSTPSAKATVSQIEDGRKQNQSATALSNKPSKIAVMEKGGKSVPFSERLVQHNEHVQSMRRADALCYGLVQKDAPTSTELVIDDKALTIFSSYSYLALNQHPAIIEAKVQATNKYGSGAHAVMMLGGYTDEHRKLEQLISRNYMCEDSILFSSGFAANLSVIDSLMGEDGFIFCDMLAHTSILDGCRISGANTQMFPHQDFDALDRMLARCPNNSPALVIVDGVYSLRGEIANLPKLVKVAKKHGALVLVDEAHALGSIGANGRGTAEYHSVEGMVDIVTGGLGKGIPAYGGYVSGRRDIIEFLRFRSNPYVYSGGMDVANVAAARAAIELMNSDPSIMERLRRNIKLMQDELVSREIPCLLWNSPCMPVVCESAEDACLLSAELMRQGYYVAPITYPAVPKDQQGLRLTVTAALTEQQILDFAETLEIATNKIQLNKVA